MLGYAVVGLVALGALAALLRSLCHRMEGSAWLVWLQGLLGGVAGLGVAVVTSTVIVYAQGYEGDPNRYLFLALLMGFSLLCFPIGVMGGVMLHFRRVPRA